MQPLASMAVKVKSTDAAAVPSATTSIGLVPVGSVMVMPVDNAVPGVTITLVAVAVAPPSKTVLRSSAALAHTVGAVLVTVGVGSGRKVTACVAVIAQPLSSVKVKSMSLVPAAVLVTSKTKGFSADPSEGSGSPGTGAMVRLVLVLAKVGVSTPVPVPVRLMKIDASRQAWAFAGEVVVWAVGRALMTNGVLTEPAQSPLAVASCTKISNIPSPPVPSVWLPEITFPLATGPSKKVTTLVPSELLSRPSSTKSASASRSTVAAPLPGLSSQRKKGSPGFLLSRARATRGALNVTGTV